ncbi:MAG: hypothetical protein D6731_15265 [Planctomycetota bacterium]|nr:MAG: hypothetical protein D6731_15265 [Planctomycetota bacterium]
MQKLSTSWPPPKEAKKAPTAQGTAPTSPAPAARKTRDDPLAKLGVRLPKSSKRKKLRSFAELGWTCTVPQEDSAAGTDVVALDLGVEGICITRFDEGFSKPQDVGQPTMVLVKDAHAFRTLEPFSLDVGLPAAERWPSERVLRGTHGSIMLPSQIGLVEFPGDHVLAGLVGKVRSQNRKELRQVVLTLPTFLPSNRGKAIRDVAAPYRKGAFAGVPSAIAAAYFYLAPGQAGVAGEGELLDWSREAFAEGRVLVLDWGASGLGYGLVTVRAGEDEDKIELRLVCAGTWPSLGGHRLTLRIAMALRDLIVQRIVAEGPSDDLVPLALLEPGTGQVPRPFGYDEGIRALKRMGKPRNELERAERARLRNLLFPTRWRFPSGEEPVGYAPYRRLAVVHFNALWKAAERIKRLILSDPARYLRRKTIPWAIQIDSPFVSHLSGSLDYPVAHLLKPVERSLDACMRHIQGRLDRRGISAPVHIAFAGMQSAGPLLRDGVQRLTSRRDAGALKDAALAPTSSDPRELKSVINRGAALLNRDRRKLDFGPVPDVLPFNIQIADAIQNITIFSAGPIDELSVFQRRVRVEEGFPQYEFLLFSSEDQSQQGSWGAIDFHKPFEFTAEDRSIAVDARYGFRGDLPLLRDLKGDEGRGLGKCYDRTTPGWNSGRISFRSYAPRESDAARRLLHFLEYGLFGNFHRKVFLLEREFRKPPKRFDYIYQRYYLSRSQELLVVREWWAPTEDGKLMRHKTLHTCQGSTEANRILGLAWGTY